MYEAVPSLGSHLRSLLLWFALAAFVLVFGVSVMRRAGLFTETLVVATPDDVQPREFQIISLLPKDAIPAIFDPRFVDADAANEQLLPEDLVIGVSINGEHRAYGVAYLSNHEVVNDVVGGRPIAVTW